MEKEIKIIDLFAGVGGIRLGFQQAANDFGIKTKCVLSSEIDKYACMTYEKNYSENPYCDVTKIDEKSIADFDVLLAGFPCQAFSIAGKRAGFEDTRGTLFFDVARIIKQKQPKAFLLENVKGLLSHNKGKTFKTIIEVLKNDLGYNVFYQVINSKDFGVPQNRERVYIVGFKDNEINFSFPTPTDSTKVIKDIMEENAVSAKYYLSEKYLNTLKAHKAKHEALGHGFGYEVRDINDIAGTIVCGGMGKERNIIKDDRQTDFSDKGRKKGEFNKECLRVMTPIEWERLQGFPDNWTNGLADCHRYKQMANSVSVPVIKAISENIIKSLNC